MDTDELRELCTLTVELTRLRQNECKHLCIENFAPELLGKLIRERMGLGADAAVSVDAALAGVRRAVLDYYAALDRREHGGQAQDKAFRAIEHALGMHWIQGSPRA